MDNNISPAFLTMFEEAQKKLDRQFKSSAILRDYIKSVIVASSVIVSFFATFRTNDSLSSNSNFIYTRLIIVVIILYGSMMILSVIALRPHSLNHAVNAKFNNYLNAYADKSKEEILEVQICKYLDAIDLNEKIIVEQSNLSTAIGVLLGAIVIIILVAVVLPLI